MGKPKKTGDEPGEHAEEVVDIADSPPLAKGDGKPSVEPPAVGYGLFGTVCDSSGNLRQFYHGLNGIVEV